MSEFSRRDFLFRSIIAAAGTALEYEFQPIKQAYAWLRGKEQLSQFDENSRLTISPNGQILTVETEGELFVVNMLDTNIRFLSPNAQNPVWSSSNQLAYIEEDEYERNIIIQDFNNIVKIMSANNPLDVSISWNPTGEITIAAQYESGWKIMLFNINSPNERKEIQVLENIYGIDQLTWNNFDTLSFRYLYQGIWDVAKLSFIVDEDGNYPINPFTYRESVLSYSFSPNDETLAYYSAGSESGLNLYARSASGEDRTFLFNVDLPKEEIPQPPSWVNDVDILSFDKDDNGLYQIVKIDSTTGESVVLTEDSESNNVNPIVSGSVIYFLSDRNGKYEIFRMDVDGANQMPLEQTTRPEV